MKSYWKEFLTDRRALFLSFVLLIYFFLLVMLNPTPWSLLFILVGIALFFVIEYVTHRYILHGILKRILPRAHEGHELHHVEPTNLRYLLTPNTYNIPCHIILWAMMVSICHSIETGSSIMLGLALYQLFYEWMHFVSHRPIIPKTSWGKWMKKYHLLHHYKNPHYWYGVTNPAIDMAVGTNPDPTVVPTERG